MLELARGVVGQGGEMWIVVTGHSMQPAIRPGDRVLLAPPKALQAGVVVLADMGEKLILHRIVTLKEGVVVLRGDAAFADDRPISISEVVGIVRKVARGAVTMDLPVTRSLSARVGTS